MSKKSSGSSKELQVSVYDEDEDDSGCIKIAVSN
jgi:hypothetical protein